MLDFEIFDRISDKIYITDIQTNEIIYANHSLLKLLGVKHIDEIKGKKCYKVLQGNDRPCSFCTNHLLKENQFYEWETYNNLFGKTFLNQDTLINYKGKICRLEITTEKDKRNEVDIFYEKLGNEVLGAALKEENIGEGINKSIGILGRKMQADRIYIFEIDGDVSNNTYEWCAQGVHAEIDNLQNISNEMLSPWYNLFATAGEVFIENIEEIKEKNPEIYEVLKPQKIHSLVAQPIYVQKKLRGFFGVDNINKDKMIRISSFMKMIAIYVSELIEKRDNRYNLEMMSKHDVLTSLYNRKFAEIMINNAIQVGSGTLLIIDLDRFKSVNDLFGHQKGDDLLREVSSKLKSACREQDIVFRLGGDEFGVFYVSLVKERDIIVKCEKILKLLQIVVEDVDHRVEVSASIGVSVAGKHGSSFMELYANADEELYKAKKCGKNRFSMKQE